MTAVIVSCSRVPLSEPEEEGNASETLAKVSGKIVDSDREAAENTLVMLVPEPFNPLVEDFVPDSLMDTTDSRGRYSFELADSGAYRIEALNLDDGTRLLIPDIRVAGDTIDMGTQILRTPGLVMVTLPGHIQTEGYLYIPNTSVFVSVTQEDIEAGEIILDSVPAGAYTGVRFTEGADLTQAAPVSEYINVGPADIAFVGPYDTWDYSAEVIINTASSGAGITGDLYDFPLLIRLSSSLSYSSSIFENAEPDGADLRFTSLNKKPLSFEVERWDPSLQQAEIWVRIDTIFSGDAGQIIYLYWGKENSPAASSGETVFSKQTGFAGVWHLGEDEADTALTEIYRNSVAEENHGDDFIISTDKAGLIGRGQYFNMNDYIRVEAPTADLKPPSRVFMSAWIRTDTTDTSGGEVVSMGNNYGLRITPAGNIWTFNYQHPRVDSTDFYLESTTGKVLDNRWHHVAGQNIGTQLQIYVDGVFSGSLDIPEGIVYDGGPYFYIGRHGNKEDPWDYEGYMDEIRVSTEIRSVDWIKMCYENQKPGSTVVRFE
jgi:hypothetical protein